MAPTSDTSGAPFTIHRDAFREVIGPDARRVLLAEINAHEGPVYVAEEHAVYFTTLPENRTVAILRVLLSGDAFPFVARAIETVQSPSNMANGMVLDRDGGLLVCEQGTRQGPARISRLDRGTGLAATIVDGWRGKPFNSPNDVVVKSDRTIWFTDPDYGALQGFRDVPQLGPYVYRHDPATGETSVVADGFDKPNGLAFSPDESVLYITDSGANQAPGTYVPDRPHHVLAYDVRDGRHLVNQRLFAVVTPGVPDGIKVDVAGHVYTSSATGVQVFTPEGDLIGEIAAPGVANFCFGGPANDVLFILDDARIWQVKLNVAGMRPS